MNKKHIRHVVYILLLTSAMSMIFMVSTLSAAEKVTAIQGGDLYTITDGIIRNGTILIEDGKISDIGQNIEVPKDAEVIDARGKVVMPGLIAINAQVGVIGYSDINKIADSLDPFEFSVSLALASGIIGTIFFPPFGGLIAVPLSIFLLEYLRARDLKKAWLSLRGLAAGWGLSFLVRYLLGVLIIILWWIWVWQG